MAAGDLQDQGPQHRLSHLPQRPSPSPAAPGVGHLPQSLPHAPFPHKSPHACAKGRIAHGLTPSPAEPAGRGPGIPYCTGSVPSSHLLCESTSLASLPCQTSALLAFYLSGEPFIGKV